MVYMMVRYLPVVYLETTSSATFTLSHVVARDLSVHGSLQVLPTTVQ